MNEQTLSRNAKGIVRYVFKNSIIIQKKYEENNFKKFMYFLSDFNKGLIFVIIFLYVLVYIEAKYSRGLAISGIIFSALFLIILFAYAGEKHNKYPQIEFYNHPDLKLKVKDEVELKETLKIIKLN